MDLTQTLKGGEEKIAKIKETKIVKEKEKDENGVEQEVEKEVQEEKDLTLGIVIEQSLMQLDGELDPDIVLLRYEVNEKIRDQKEVELKDEEKKVIKKLICRRWQPFLAGQALQMLK